MPPEFSSFGQLSDAFISSVTFRRNLDFDWAEDEVPSYVVDATTEAFVGDDHDGGVVDLRAAIHFEHEHRDGKDPFDLEVTVTGVFTWRAPEMSADDISGWLEFNSMHLLWPYLRAEVSRVTNAAGIVPLTIYTIGIPRPHIGRDRPGPVDPSHTPHG